MTSGRLLAAVAIFFLLGAAACGKKAEPQPTTTSSASNVNALIANLNRSATNTTNTTNGSTFSTGNGNTNAAISPTTVSVKNGSFDPVTLTVKKGATVVFRNDGTSNHRVATDPHPAHTGLPGFDLGSMAPGSSQSYTFTKVGIFGYHDHLNALAASGTIIVTE